MFFTFFFLIILLCGITPAGTAGSDFWDSRYTAHFNVQSGLPNSTVTCICQTRDGFIWLGTFAGLVRFDGVFFKHFNRWNTPDLKNDRIQALFADREGKLWIGTAGGGLVSYDSGKWQCYTVAEGLSNDHVRAITQDRAGYLWIGTDYGLNRKNAQGFDIFTAKDGLLDNLITSLAVDLHGTLWIGTLQGGISRWENLYMRTFGPQDGLLNTQIFAVYPDRLGNVWVGTGSGVFVLNPETDRFVRIPGTSYTPVTSFMPSGHGGMLIGTMADGVKFYNGVMTDGPALPDDYIHNLLMDNLERLWIGTHNAGLVQVRQRIVGNMTFGSEQASAVVTAVLNDGKGRLWIGSKEKGLWFVENEIIRQFAVDQARFSDSTINSLCSDSSGTVWVATAGLGIARISGDRVTWYTSQQGLASDNVTAVYCRRHGEVWIGTDSGLCMFGNGEISRDHGFQDLPVLPVRVIQPDLQGDLLVGTVDGLYRLSEKKVEKISNGEISALWLNDKETLYIGTNGDGLIQLSGGVIKTCTTQNGLIDNFITGLYRSVSGSLWIGTSKGIMCLNSAQLDAFFKADSSFLFPLILDSSCGLKNSRCSGYGLSGVSAARGYIYFPTAGGLAVFSPEKVFAVKETPIAFIDEVSVQNRELRTDDNLVIKRGKQISFRITATGVPVPELLRFLYRLQGFEHQHRALFAGQSRTVTYADLKPGKYRFEVTAVGFSGVSSDSTVVLPIKVKSAVLTPVRILVIWIALMTGAFFIFQRKKKKGKYLTSSLVPERAQKSKQDLIRYVQTNKPFLDPDLTLAQLAKALKIHPNHLSQIINEHFGVGFNDFINSYRIEEAKRLLTDPAHQEKSILQIMLDAGFYSKSVFNTAFKKFTGKTPSQYRNNNLAQPNR